MVVGSWIAKAIGGFLLAVLPITVQTNAGKTLSGEFEGFTNDELLLKRSGEISKFKFSDLTSMQVEQAEEQTGPTFQVRMIGGSRILAQDLTLDDNGLVIEPRRQKRLVAPVKRVKSIRFRQPSAGTDAQWLGILERESRGDTLVIRRADNRLDPQQGIVMSMSKDTVVFSLDGTEINAPIERLEGLVFGGSDDITEDAAIQITDVYGSQWAVTELTASAVEQPLQLRLGEQISHELPLSQIVSVRWSSGLAMLAKEAPASSTFKNYLSTNVDSGLLDQFFGPRVLADTDLLMNGGSSVEYRIAPGYRTFSGTVRRDATVGKTGQLTVRVTLDGDTVWEESLENTESRGFELPVENARRLAIEVDSGDDGDLGDRVRISRPRLLK